MRRAPRGTSLIEGMVAMAIFSIGILGTIQMLLLASRQNSVAGRITYAAGIARQARSALQLRGLTFLAGPAGPLRPGACASAPEVVRLAGPAAGVGCVIDLDAYEGPGGRLMPGYPTEDRDRYRRVLVSVPDPAGKVDAVTVVVSFESAGQRMFASQSLALYHVTANQAGVEL